MQPVESDDRPTPRRRYRSLFWPLLLIGLGVLLLLGELGILEPVDWWSLLRFWPALLMVAGVDLLLGRRPLVGAVLGLALLAGVVALLLWGGKFGWLNSRPLTLGGVRVVTDADVKHDVYSAPVGAAESAVIELHLGALPTTVGSLAGGDKLIEASVDHVGEMRFEGSGDGGAHILLAEQAENLGWVSWPASGSRYRWDIALSPKLPLDMVLNASSGRADLQLEQLRLDRLALSASSGALAAALPASVREIEFDGSSGRADLTLADETDATFKVEMSSGALGITVGQAAKLAVTVSDGSSGGMTISVPSGTPLRVEVRDSSSGSVRVPRELDEVQRGKDDEGIWQTSGWQTGGLGVSLLVEEMSSGSIVVKYR